MPALNTHAPVPQVLDVLCGRALVKFEWHAVGGVEIERWLAAAETEAERHAVAVEVRRKAYFRARVDGAGSAAADAKARAWRSLARLAVDLDRLATDLKQLDKDGGAIGSVRWAALWRAEERARAGLVADPRARWHVRTVTQSHHEWREILTRRR